MKNIYTRFILMLMILSSCNYLDIVPDETAKEEDAFQNARSAEGFLYSCYSYLPDPRDDVQSLDLMTSDEVVTPYEHETFANFPKGNYNASNPIISYWSTLFSGIRQCYILLNNIDKVPNMPASDVIMYKGEAKFLIAYFHFLLLKNYGPVLLIKKEYPIDTPVSDFPERDSYDDCVEWIAALLDEAATMLPVEQRSSAYGRATSVAAKAIKSRMLLYAASPLFNGNSEFYSEFKSKVDGRNLISQSYSVEKWERAANASKEALDYAMQHGHSLYESTMTGIYSQPIDPTERTLRLVYIDYVNSKEVLWADTRKEKNYGIQYKSTPYLIGPASGNGMGVTLELVETFYSKNGLPIAVDPEFDYSRRYAYAEYHRSYCDGVTMNLNIDREPRFYAWVAFHNGYYEIQRNGKDKIQTQFRKNDTHGIKSRTMDYSPTGYLNKKGVSPLYAATKEIDEKPHYPWPVIRLAELYLNYAEALANLGRIEEAKQVLDVVRIRAGIPTINQAWGKTNESIDKDRMIAIVQQERTIELFMEGHRFWDIRRWKQGDRYFNCRPQGMNFNGATDADFFTVTEVVVQRKFSTPTNYLMPIPKDEVNKNERKLVQNPGY